MAQFSLATAWCRHWRRQECFEGIKDKTINSLGFWGGTGDWGQGTGDRVGLRVGTGDAGKKYINIPSEKYIYVHIYVYICEYT